MHSLRGYYDGQWDGCQWHIGQYSLNACCLDRQNWTPWDTGPWHHPQWGGGWSFYGARLPEAHGTMDPDAEEGQLDSINPQDHPHSSKETQACSISRWLSRKGLEFQRAVEQEEVVGLGSLFRHRLETDSVPTLGRGTEVAEMWAMGTEFRELDIWWEKRWIPTIKGNI